jgi:tetratricopeptide (TPR) repeat protein
MTAPYKYFSKHFFRNVLISLFVFFAFCLFIYANKTEVEASILKCCIEELPDDYLNIGEFYVEAGKPKSAIKLLNKACKVDPENRGTYLEETGYIYIDNIGNNEAGIEALEKACQINPELLNNCVFYDSLCKAYISSGKQVEAIKVAEKVYAVDPNNLYTCLSAIVKVYEDACKYDEAISVVKRGIQINPKDPTCWGLLGDEYATAERYEEAIQAYEKRVEIDPDNAWPHVCLAFTYKHMHQYNEAIEEINLVMKMVEPDKEASLNGLLGSFYYEAGQYENAISAYKECLMHYPERKEVHYHLGKAYLQVGNKDLALEEYKILKTLDEKSANELWGLIKQ